MKKIAGFVLSVAALAMATPAAAQFQKPEDAVKYRQSAFTIMGNHMGRVGAMVMGRVPFDAKAAQDSTRVLALVSTLPGQTFTANTESVQGSKALRLYLLSGKSRTSSRQVMTRWLLKLLNSMQQQKLAI